MQWPNWVDLVVVTIFLRTCYSGFGRGLWAELLAFGGVVFATAVSINSHGLIAGWLLPIVGIVSPLGSVFIICALFLTVILIVQLLLRWTVGLLRGGRFDWVIQGLGLVVGGVRGLWWAGFILVVLTSTGIVYCHDSVRLHSVSGPRLEPLARQAIGLIVSRFPGFHGQFSFGPRSR